ncbi:hypothetical protein EOB36_03660 [Mesorhizobium sp. M6A.T.Cr.TU.017.01.1.1]|uniref:hypothetical protein n=1 Tax=Mesorhizobium sp. M6A.T.Cr.TU.017.01.1.1 TaxID=2496774 RepID=UPI000FD1BBDA|nr:hypothetical protein [Mesorhizobium sp. M6A.T.Cr.TU.017.01.1.1]RUV04138.1 hypothetical protein EOB36_03660 [Mesorhizobium sp. M6A.T.Cr.TU.017.01.1.1]
MHDANVIDFSRWKISLATLSPSELEAASGLSTELQRVWRRRGQLSDRQGTHARFTAQEAAAVAVAVALTKQGFMPGDAVVMGKTHAALVLRLALLRGGMCEVIGSKDGVKEFRAIFDNDVKMVATLVGDETQEPLRFLFSLDNELPVLSDPELDQIDIGNHLTGYFINLDKIAFNIIRALDRPLLSVELNDEGEGGERKIRSIV